jgi:hypothetical protein
MKEILLVATVWVSGWLIALAVVALFSPPLEWTVRQMPENGVDWLYSD